MVLPQRADTDTRRLNTLRVLLRQRDLGVMPEAPAPPASVELGMELATVVRISKTEDLPALATWPLPLEVSYLRTTEAALGDVELVLIDRLRPADTDSD